MRIPWTEEPGRLQCMGCKESDTIEQLSLHFTGGPGVRNLPANAEDMGSIPGLRRSHMPQGNPVPQLLKPTNSRARELQLLKLMYPKACALQQEKPLQ